MKSIFLSAVIFLLAISPATAEDVGDGPGNNADGAFAEVVFAYTEMDLSQCFAYQNSEWEEDAEIDEYAAECPGFGGYRPFVAGGDIRYPLGLLWADVRIEVPSYWNFNSATTGKVEWRGRRTEDGIDYTAFIYRTFYQDLDEATGLFKRTSSLSVVRLNKENSCYLGTVNASGDMNVVARQLADDQEAPCRSAEEIFVYRP